MRINRQLAPGLGDLLPGSFVVPQNPLMPTRYIPKIGDLLPSRFAVPANPLISAIRGGLSGLSGCSGGCGCGGGSTDSSSGTGFLNGVALPGIGGLGDGLASVNWWTVGIAVGAVMLLTRSKKR